MKQINIFDMNKIVYKKWSFRLLLYLIIINMTSFYMIANYADGFDNAEKLTQNLKIISILGNLFLLIGTILSILSIAKKEEKNYQYYISIIGYPFFILLTLISLF